MLGTFSPPHRALSRLLKLLRGKYHTEAVSRIGPRELKHEMAADESWYVTILLESAPATSDNLRADQFG